MVAALFRNLLSQRIMIAHRCHPQPPPALPDTHHHPLWNSRYLAVEMGLVQLPALKKATTGALRTNIRTLAFFTEQLAGGVRGQGEQLCQREPGWYENHRDTVPELGLHCTVDGRWWRWSGKD